MRLFPEHIRKPQNDISLKRKLIETVSIILFGFALGIFQKWMDGIAVNDFPVIIQQLDISNYFGRLSIWILLAAAISVYAKSPVRAAVNTFLFFISMLSGYYIYCNYISGFLPVTYMMMWFVISFAAFFLAYICWYAKGEGIAAIVISSMILGILLAFSLSLNPVWGFYVYDVMDLLTWIAGVILLRRKGKEYALEIGLSFVIAFVFQLSPFFFVG